MKGDFTRDRFDPARNYTAVLNQQGRVTLDADWNEQASIQQHLMRTMIVDLMGPAAGPVDACGFGLADGKKEGVTVRAGDFALGAGRYYVGGLLVENGGALAYSAQPFADPPERLEEGKTYLACLDVWERHVTWLDDPGLREVALGGPDTCTRKQTVWQVLTIETEEHGEVAEDGDRIKRDPDAIRKELEKLEARDRTAEAEGAAGDGTRKPQRIAAERRKLAAEMEALRGSLENAVPFEPGDAGHRRCWGLIEELRNRQSGTLAVRVRPAEPSNSPCVLPPESRYRGLENQLYRVEVHQSGDTADTNNLPSFKWSRDNGSVTTRWLETKGKNVRVMSARGFAPNCWVEILTETDELHGRGGHLGRVVAIDGDLLTLADAPPSLGKNALNPRVRRWDCDPRPANAKGAVDVVAGEADKGWIALEHGIEIRFSAGSYRAGDYWLIPARVATGGIEWPEDATGQPLDLPPKGIVHHYAPLFLFNATGKAPFAELVEDCRCRFAPLACVRDLGS